MFEQFDHHSERRFLRHSDRLITSGNIVGQADQGTTRLDVLKVMERKVVADDPGRAIRGLVDGIGAFPLLVHEAVDRLRIKLALALEIAIEAASRQSRAGHDVIDRDTRETMTVE